MARDPGVADKSDFIDTKAFQYGRDLESSGFDLVGKNVDFPNDGGSIDILLIGFGDSPQVGMRNYHLESIPEEMVINDSRYEDWKELLPNPEWGLDPRQVRTSRDSLGGCEDSADWDFCYTSLERSQLSAFSRSFLGYDLERLERSEWVEWEEEYF